MTPPSPHQSTRHVLTRSFVKHQRAYGIGLLICWFFINVIVLATSVLMESNRAGKVLAAWEPFCWEASSAIMILLLIPVAVSIYDKWIVPITFKTQLFAHALLTVPFSIAHVAGMVSIRHICYNLMGMEYNFGNIPVEFFYEYRKDAQSYFTIAIVIFGYRFIVRRLQGEASYLAENENSEAIEPTPERLLIKKLGREFLIKVSDIEWVEASGNYANLHIKESIYPMRITMEKLIKALPSGFARIHRSTIVNLEHIKEIQPLDTGDYQVTLLNNKNLLLSRRYRDAFKTEFQL